MQDQDNTVGGEAPLYHTWLVDAVQAAINVPGHFYEGSPILLLPTSWETPSKHSLHLSLLTVAPSWINSWWTMACYPRNLLRWPSLGAILTKLCGRCCHLWWSFRESLEHHLLHWCNYRLSTWCHCFVLKSVFFVQCTGRQWCILRSLVRIVW